MKAGATLGSTTRNDAVTRRAMTPKSRRDFGWGSKGLAPWPGDRGRSAPDDTPAKTTRQSKRLPMLLDGRNQSIGDEWRAVGAQRRQATAGGNGMSRSWPNSNPIRLRVTKRDPPIGGSRNHRPEFIEPSRALIRKPSGLPTKERKNILRPPPARPNPRAQDEALPAQMK